MNKDLFLQEVERHHSLGKGGRRAMGGLKPSAITMDTLRKRYSSKVLPFDKSLQDGFRYEVFYTAGQAEYWIVQSGGVGFQRTIFGPGEIDL